MTPPVAAPWEDDCELPPDIPGIFEETGAEATPMAVQARRACGGSVPEAAAPTAAPTAAIDRKAGFVEQLGRRPPRVDDDAGHCADSSHLRSLPRPAPGRPRSAEPGATPRGRAAHAVVRLACRGVRSPAVGPGTDARSRHKSQGATRGGLWPDPNL